MRYNALVVMLILLQVITVSSNAQKSEEFKPSGKFLGLLFTNYHSSFTGGENISAFEVSRSYLGYEYNFSRTFSSRILYDGITEETDGKIIYSGYLRNAYLQYSGKYLTIKGGLTGLEHTSASDKIWGYRYIAKSPDDNTGMVQSTDLGISTILRTGKIINLDFSVTNGRGYKDIEADGTYRFAAGFTLTPFDNLIFRGYYDMMGPSDRTQRTTSFTAAWKSSGFTAGGEYAHQDNNKMIKGNNYSCTSFFSTVSVSEKMNLFVRYDNVQSVIPDEGTDPWNIEKDGSYLFAGIDFSPVKNIRVSPNMKSYFPADNNTDKTITISLNLEAKF